MAGHIFYRERVKVKEKAQTPRFRIVGVEGIDLKIYAEHLRKKELEQIAEVTGARLVALQRDEKSLAKKK